MKIFVVDTDSAMSDQLSDVVGQLQRLAGVK
jgi:hypothetical protein